MLKQHLFRRDDLMLMAEAGLFQNQKVELLNGVIFDMRPANPIHEDSIDKLARRFTRALLDDALVRTEKGLDLGDPYWLPHPDIALVKLKDYDKARPTAQDVYLLIEVALTTLSTDLGEKRQAYAKANIMEYWVADLEKGRSHIHQMPNQQGYWKNYTLNFQEKFAPVAFPECVEMWL
ncbi:MAG: Uma2 family endonuclease [Deinococcales bacterium]